MANDHSGDGIHTPGDNAGSPQRVSAQLLHVVSNGVSKVSQLLRKPSGGPDPDLDTRKDDQIAWSNYWDRKPLKVRQKNQLKNQLKSQQKKNKQDKNSKQH